MVVKDSLTETDLPQCLSDDDCASGCCVFVGSSIYGMCEHPKVDPNLQIIQLHTGKLGA